MALVRVDRYDFSSPKYGDRVRSSRTVAEISRNRRRKFRKPRVSDLARVFQRESNGNLAKSAGNPQVSLSYGLVDDAVYLQPVL